jgi:DNA-binding transcriptional regulator LsrR (DeoR family)
MKKQATPKRVTQKNVEEEIVKISGWEDYTNYQIAHALTPLFVQEPAKSVISKALSKLRQMDSSQDTEHELLRHFGQSSGTGATERNALSSKNLRVVRTLSNTVKGGESSEAKLGKLASEVFEAHLATRKLPLSRLALGSGHAVGAFVDALEPGTRKVTVAPTSMALRTADGTSHDAIWNVLKFHWEASEQTSSPCICAIPPFVREEAGHVSHLKKVKSLQAVYEAAKRADFVVIGIGSVGGDSPIRRVLNAYGVNESQIDDRVAGEVNLSLLDENGNDITAEIFSVSPKASSQLWEGSHPAYPALGISALRAIADDPKRTVLAIAAGSHKVQPIRAALMAGLINILVTDDSTAASVLAGLD